MRGEGKHTIVEINGLKELACAAGGSGFACTEVFTNNCFHNLFIPILFVLVQMLDVSRESHQRAFRTHPVRVLFSMFVQDFPLYRGLITEYFFRELEPYYASNPKLTYVFGFVLEKHLLFLVSFWFWCVHCVVCAGV